MKLKISIDETCIEQSLYRDRSSQVDRIEAILQVKSTDQILENMTSENLKDAVEMFLYLNACPFSIQQKSWFVFYKDIFQTKSPGEIILTLNRMIKGTHKNIFYKKLAQNMFDKIISFISMKYESNGCIFSNLEAEGQNVSKTQNCKFKGM